MWKGGRGKQCQQRVLGEGMLMSLPRCIHYSFSLPHKSFSSKAVTEEYHVIHAGVRSG